MARRRANGAGLLEASLEHCEMRVEYGEFCGTGASFEQVGPPRDHQSRRARMQDMQDMQDMRRGDDETYLVAETGGVAGDSRPPFV